MWIVEIEQEYLCGDGMGMKLWGQVGENPREWVGMEKINGNWCRWVQFL